MENEKIRKIEELDAPISRPESDSDPKGYFVKDPWEHRSRNMICRTCIWFVKKTSPISPLPTTVGRCRRHAPTMNGYPVVFLTDWCGDHKLDENAI